MPSPWDIFAKTFDVNHKKVHIFNDAGVEVDAAAPVIVSASRSTDIPAFYSDWFFNRLERGYVSWQNPFNGKDSYVSFAETRFVVFWSKNPAPLLPYLRILEERGIGFYIQFTLNDYVAEGLEPGVPPLQQRIATFFVAAYLPKTLEPTTPVRTSAVTATPTTPPRRC